MRRRDFGRWHLYPYTYEGGALIQVYGDSANFGNRVLVGSLHLNLEDMEDLIGIFERGSQS